MTDANLPRGTVTFLFTDVEGSTRLWEADRTAMQAAVAQHDQLLAEAVRAHHGHLFKHIGDSAQAAFATAGEGLAAALTAQQSFAAASWPATGPLPVRMALHTGEAFPDLSGDYNQVASLNRLARLLGAGHGGQILLTEAVRRLLDGAVPPGIALRDLGEHRLRDLVQPEHVWQAVVPGLRSDFPPLRSLERPLTNLPAQPTSFIGREEDVARIRALIEREKTRLVTLTGPGGTGKTRLAQAVAAELVEAFPDGVWFVDLAPLADPALVETTIATTLGVREMGARPLREALVDFVGGRRLLLVIDNFEHLLAAAGLVSDLLQAGPEVVILATSREPLRLRGEREIAVAPLALPKIDRLPPVAELAKNPSVALFVQRAQAAKTGFVLSDENAAAIAAICRRLDGLPLAIELAAARVKLLPPPALLTRLNQSLPVLTGGPRDAPARQRTLRDAIAWSHDLLDADEQALFRCLSVFAGGFSFEAAEDVGGKGGDAALDGIASLVDKSLVRHSEGAEGEPRFTMLETIREFAVEQLQRSGEADAVRNAHAAWSRETAADWRSQVWGSRQRTIQERVVTEADNFRGALDWLMGRGDVAQAATFVVDLVDFWYMRSQLREATEWLERIHVRARELPIAQVAAIESRLASLLPPLEESARADALAEHAVQLHRELRGTPDFDERELAFALFVFGSSQADPAPRIESLQEALAHFRARGDTAWMGHVLSNLAIAALDADDADQAIAFAEEAVDLQRRAQNEWGLSLAKIILAEMLRTNGDATSAMRHFQEALAIVRQSEDFWRIANCLQSIAAIVASGNQVVTAARLLGSSVRLRARYGAIRETELWQEELWPFDPALAAEIRGAIGDQVFTAEFRAGMEAPLDEMIEVALDELV